MNRALSTVFALASLALASALGATARADEGHAARLELLSNAFFEYSGTRLVFSTDQLPAGPFFDALPELPVENCAAAAMLLCHEAQKYPPQYLGKLNLKAIGVFQACIAKQGDGFRSYDRELQGYRYYGLNNGRDALVAAYYTDEQLPLTFHHEIFHSVDRLTGGDANGDPVLAEMLAGKAPYPPLRLRPADLSAIKRHSGGALLEGAVSKYAAKNPGEDKAETARYLMSALPDSLVQAAEESQLADSQRIMHVLGKYQLSNDGHGPDAAWFARLAADHDAIAALDLTKTDPQGVAVLLRLRRLTASAGAVDAAQADAAHASASPVSAAPVDPQQSRQALQQAAAIALSLADPKQADQIARLAVVLMMQRARSRIQSPSDGSFIVRGGEDADGVNWTLRRDVAELSQAADQFKVFAKSAPASRELLAGVQVQFLRLLGGDHAHIAGHWQVTDGTRQVFEEARNRLAASLPPERSALAVRIMQSDLQQLAQALTADGQWQPRGDGTATATDTTVGEPKPGREPKNPYLANIEAEVKDPLVRAAIRRVQPSCVRFINASGVAVTAAGCVLTAAHVAGKINSRHSVTFPDGQQCEAVCIAIDPRLDLALCRIHAPNPLPFARLALAPPVMDTPVVCIGQPGAATPAGKATGYKPFTVSTGRIRGFSDDRLGDQHLGRAKHDAWTYWGHSGSPLFNERGEIVALHNSWDSTTAMRHAVTHEAIAKFLHENLPVRSP